MSHKNIYYSEKYYDNEYEYRYGVFWVFSTFNSLQNSGTTFCFERNAYFCECTNYIYFFFYKIFRCWYIYASVNIRRDYVFKLLNLLLDMLAYLKIW